MNLVQIGTAVTLLVLDGLPGPQTRFSPPVLNPGLDVIGCIAQNVGGQPVTVAADLHDDEGAIVDSGTVVVPPGRTVEIADSAAIPSGYCGFAFDADPETVRGYLRLRQAAGDTLALFPSFGVRAGPGATSETVTPPLRSISMAEEIGCLVQNVSDETVDVDAALVDESGAVIDADTAHALAGSLVIPVASSAAHLGAYCRFSAMDHGGAVRGYVVLFGAPGNAHLEFPAVSADAAGSLVGITPAVSSLAGDATACGVQNLDSVPRMVTAKLIDTAGTVLADGGAVVQPGRVQTLAGHTEAGTSAVCRFTFTDPADQVRGFITRFASGVFRNTDLLALAEVSQSSAPPGAKTYSPPLGVGTDRYLQCVATNLSAAGESVHSEIDDGSGTIVALSDVNVPAGRGKSASITQDLNDGFCTFAFDGRPDDVRGYAALLDASGQRTQQVFAAAPGGPSPTTTATPRPTFTGTITPTTTATLSGTPTASATASATTTATVAPTRSAGIPSATPTAATTPGGGACLGDCDGNGTVTIDELITLVNIALGAPLASCPAGDGNGDGEVTIEELVSAVGNALDGCPAA